MKKTILIVLTIALFATPCLAQEVEPQGMLTIDGTVWQALPIGLKIFRLPGIWDTNGLQFVFYGDTGSSYIDMLACSIFWAVEVGPFSYITGRYFGILQPIGIGMVVKTDFRGALTPFSPPNISIALLVKIKDNWVPPEFVSISPNKGEQGAILKDVTIRGLNTYFAYGDNIVMFRPAKYGDIISNIRPISDTEIKFDLELEADAPIGFRGVDVTWDGGIGKGRGHVGASDVFEVLGSTN